MSFWPRNGLKVAVLSLSIFLKSGLRPRFFHMIVYFGSLAVARDLMGLAGMTLALWMYATMTYLLPQLDVMGKRPVWLVSILWVTVIVCILTRLVWSAGPEIGLAVVMAAGMVGRGAACLVLHMFWWVSLR